MLKIFIAIFAAVFTLSSASAAQTEYLLVGKDVFFYSLDTFEEESKLFILPEDFYVELIAEEDGYFKVAYQASRGGYVKIIGYVKKENVFKEKAVAPLYPKISLVALKNTTIYSEKSLKTPISSVLSSQSVCVYGVTENQLVAFCAFGKESGYIDLSAFEAFDPPTHPINTPKRQESSEIDEKPPSEQTFSDELLPSSIQTLLFIFIAIPVVILTFLLFSVKRSDK